MNEKRPLPGATGGGLECFPALGIEPTGGGFDSFTIRPRWVEVKEMTTECLEATTITIREMVAELGLNLSPGQQSAIGQTAALLCKARGIPLVKRFDGKWTANAYPVEILVELMPAILEIAEAGPEAVEGPLPDGSSWRVHCPWEVAR